jgi:hypothetical protein
MKPVRLLALTLSTIAVLWMISYSIIDGLARMRSASVMADGANKFLNSLSAEQKGKAVFSFNDEQRYDWHFVPRARKGLPLKELNADQRKLAMEFLKTGLSASGYQKATTIISLEPVLKELEAARPNNVRDEELYYFSVFGTPSVNEVWGWRVEGHHISLNFTVVKGDLISTTPHFFGANPAEVKQGPRQGVRALAGEEDQGRNLVKALDEQQRAIAIFDKTAPRDIVTTNIRKADPLKPEGLPFSQMKKEQKDLLNKLLEEYLSRMPQDIADDRRKKLRNAGMDKIHFAWAGGLERGEGHYYRLQGTTFLIEYDDTQNNANHIHTVWRDFNGDFGADLLRAHYTTTPHDQQISGLIYESRDLGREGVTWPKILSKAIAKYTPEARRKKIKGLVELSVIFTADGRIVIDKVIRDLPYGLTDQAIAAAQKILFNPATKDGQPVNVRSNLTFSFETYRM